MKGVVIKWRNRWSGEEGFVKGISIKNGHFINTYDITEAHVYVKKSSISTALTTLKNIGETEHNDFFTIEV